MTRPLVIAAVAALALGACGERRAGRPDVVLVTLDTTRADRLSCYGYGRQTSPRLDELARSSLRYEHARAISSWTLPPPGAAPDSVEVDEATLRALVSLGYVR